MRAISFLSVLCAVLLLTASAHAENAVRRFAIIAGANDGGAERVLLRYAQSDAERFAELLGELGGVDEADLMLLLEPETDGLSSAFAQMQQQLATADAARRTELVFYYSGHSDESGLLLGGERYSYKELRASLSAMGADVNIVVLDSCSAGAFTRTKGGTHRTPFLIDESTEIVGHAFLTSSSADEAAQESDRINGSFFTHYLIAGLRGGADNSGDGKVSLTEAYQFAFSETLNSTESTQSGPQHPVYEIQLTGTGDLVLTDLRRSQSRLLLDKGLDGRLFVRNSAGQLSAELHKGSGREVELHLPADDYSLRLVRADGSVAEAELGLLAAQSVAVAEADFANVALEASVRRGDELDAGTELEADAQRAHLHIGGDLFPGVGSSSVVGLDSIRDYSINIVGMSAGIEILEIGAAANVVTDYVHGVQIAGAANVVTGDVDGVQISGAVNFADRLDGAQLAGAVNYAHARVSGVQLSGAVNIAREGMDGVQLGTVNLSGGTVDGAMFGVVNVAENTDFALGVVNVFWNGRSQLEAFGAGIGAVGLQFKHGGEYFHYIYGAQWWPSEEMMIWSPILGFGGHMEAWGNTHFDLDLIAQHVNLDEPWTVGISELASLRLSFGWRLFDTLVLSLGGGYDVLVSEYENGPHSIGFVSTHLGGDERVSVTGYPSVFVGVGLNR